MGYDFCFVFNPDEKLDCEAVVQKFVRLGARRIPAEDMGPAAADIFVDVLLPDFKYVISVFKREPANLKGNWVDIRMSWAEDAESMTANLMYLLDLADKLSCRVFDAQVQEYVTRENLGAIVLRFSKIARNIIGLIDKVKKAGDS